MNRTIVAHFEDADEAQGAVSELETAGFTAEDMGYVAHDGSGRLAQRLQTQDSPGSRSATGATVGGVSGAILGVAALAVPGIGPVIAAGPLAMALAGAGVGAATGGVLGALADIGVPETDAKNWAQKVEQGGSLVTVRVNEGTHDRAIRVLRAHAPESLMEHDVAVKQSGTAAFDPDDPHSSAPNYGDEGGSSQWTQTVLRVRDGEEQVAERTRRGSGE
jgi:uncharacterized membrane protein